MQFLQPNLLWALGALSIPLIVHLFSFRRVKTIQFSNIAFLKEVKEETASKSKIKHWLVLASRLLALLFIILAFAQPYIPKKNTDLGAGKKNVSVYIDNSFSMRAVKGGVSLLEKAKLAAQEIVKNYAPNDQFQLITNDLLGRQQRLVSKEEFLGMVEEVEISAASKKLNEIVTKQKNIIGSDNSPNQIFYLISDFQKNMGTFKPDSIAKYNLIHLEAEDANNLFVDTCWFSEPIQLLGQTNQLIIRIKNSGDKNIENARLNFKLNNTSKAIADFSVRANSFVYDTLSYIQTQAGWNEAVLSLEDYPITYDDNYFLAYSVVKQLKVSVISENGNNPFLDVLFKNQPEFLYQNVSVNSLNYEQIKNQHLIVLTNLKTISSGLAATLQNQVEKGSSLCIFPGEKCDKENYNTFLRNLQISNLGDFVETPQECKQINTKANLLKGIFEKIPENIQLPKAYKYYSINSSSNSLEEPIFTLINGVNLLAKYPFKAGSVFLSASPLGKNYSDLAIHSLFAPMLYKMSISNQSSDKIAYIMHDKNPITFKETGISNESIYKIKGKGIEFIPSQFASGDNIHLSVQEQIKEAGIYEAKRENNKEAGNLFAMNFSRLESFLNFSKISDLKENYPQSNVHILENKNNEVGAVIKELDKGTSLWKLCLVLALLFLAIEIFLLRFWKV